MPRQNKVKLAWGENLPSGNRTENISAETLEDKKINKTYGL